MSDKPKKGLGILKLIGIAAVLLLTVIVLIPLVVDVNQFRPELESRLTTALGRQVRVGNLKLSLLSGGIAADEIGIADDPKFSQSPFVRAQALKVGVEMRPLIFSRALRITAISLDRPEISLIRSASGDWNFSNIGGKSSGKSGEKQGEGRHEPFVSDVSIGSLTITDGRVTVTHSGGRLKSYVYDHVDVTARDLSFTSVFPFTLTATLPGGGGAKLDGKAGPMNSADVSLTPLAATLAIAHFDLIASGFIEPGSGLGGIIDFNCSLSSDGDRAQTKGHASADKLQLVKGSSPAGRPVSIEFTLNHDLKRDSGVLSEAVVECNQATIHLNGNYDMKGDSIVLKMKLHGEGMPVQDLEALLPAAGVTLPRGASLQGGTLSIDTQTEGPIERMVTTGTMDLSKTRLVGFDLGSKVATVASLAGVKTGSVTEIEKLASGMRVTPEGIQISGLSLILPALGQLTGDGTVSSNQSLDFKMLAKLNASGGVAGGLARLAGNNGLSVPFFIRGTASDPKFVPDVKGVAGSLLNSVTGEGKGSLGDLLHGMFNKKKKQPSP
ncbi:MAG: AsmA family protein [Acidobacteriota bacterium]